MPERCPKCNTEVSRATHPNCTQCGCHIELERLKQEVATLKGANEGWQRYTFDLKRDISDICFSIAIDSNPDNIMIKIEQIEQRLKE